MDQKKIGSFLRELRKEKTMTQEQLAEHFFVTRRTVSRWETGSNLPDLSILIELSDFYDVDLRELLDGERKEKSMNQEMKETVKKVADYSSAETERVRKRMHYVFIAGFVVSILYLILLANGFGDTILAGMSLGFMIGDIIGGIIASGPLGSRCRAFKRRLLHKGGKSEENS